LNDLLGVAFVRVNRLPWTTIATLGLADGSPTYFAGGPAVGGPANESDGPKTLSTRGEGRAARPALKIGMEAFRPSRPAMGLAVEAIRVEEDMEGRMVRLGPRGFVLASAGGAGPGPGANVFPGADLLVGALMPTVALFPFKTWLIFPPAAAAFIRRRSNIDRAGNGFLSTLVPAVACEASIAVAVAVRCGKPIPGPNRDVDGLRSTSRVPVATGRDGAVPRWGRPSREVDGLLSTSRIAEVAGRGDGAITDLELAPRSGIEGLRSRLLVPTEEAGPGGPSNAGFAV